MGAHDRRCPLAAQQAGASFYGGGDRTARASYRARHSRSAGGRRRIFRRRVGQALIGAELFGEFGAPHFPCRSEEQTSELQSLMRISYAVFCLKKKNSTPTIVRIRIVTYSNNNSSKKQHNDTI